jgi:hypothetical protein
MNREIPQIEINIINPYTVQSKFLTDNIDIAVRLKCLSKLAPDKITIQSLEVFLASRLPDPTRDDIKDILKKYGVREFNAYAMCRKSHGVMMQDFIWLKFDGEDVSFNDIRLR